MLNIVDSHVPGALVKYFANEFADTVGDDSFRNYGRWLGEGCKRLGLYGVVTPQQFRRVATNRHPSTGHRLTQRRAAKPRAAYDLTFSAPKSISVMSEVLGDERMGAAHDEAVVAAMDVVEKLAQTRVRRSGIDENRRTGNLVAACFRHHQSRSSDPQLHSHVIVANATFDEVEGCWKALQPGEIYRRSGLLTEVYRTELRANLHRIGYPTERTKDGFEIVGVPEAVIKRFSKRRAQIDEIESELGSSGNPKLREAIAMRSREVKADTQDAGKLRAGWLGQLTPGQVTALEVIKRAAKSPARVPEVSEVTAIEHAASHCFERRDVVQVHQLLREALVVGNGTVTLAQLERELPGVRGLVLQGDFATTRQAIHGEVRLIQFVNESCGKFEPLNPGFTPKMALGLEQQAAVCGVLSCRDRAMELTGPAGSAKTTTLKSVSAGIRAAGKNVVATAPTTVAVGELVSSGFSNALTLQRLLSDRRRQDTLAGAVIVVDEAGMVSVADLSALFGLAKQLGWRVILCGDTRQHHSVEAGDGLRLLEQHSGIKRFELNEVHRQQHLGYQHCVELLADGESSKALREFSAMGWISEIPDTVGRLEAIAVEYVDAVGNGETCIAVCATRREAGEVSTQIRVGLKGKGLIGGDERQVAVLDAVHFTDAERRLAHLYEPGHVIAFRKKTKYFQRGEEVEVTAVQGASLVVKHTDGRKSEVRPSRLWKNFSVFAPRVIGVSSGDSLTILANSQCLGSRKLVNGEIVIIDTINEVGYIFLRDGRAIPPHFRHFTHGYAVTSHRAQGKTVDRVIVAIDSLSARCAVSLQTIYVAASRGRCKCSIYTDNSEVLRENVCRSGERQSALELFGLTPRLKKPNGPQLARASTKPIRVAVQA